MQKERALVGVCRPPPGQREREDAKGVGTGRRVQSVVQKSKVLTHGKQNALFCERPRGHELETSLNLVKSHLIG